MSFNFGALSTPKTAASGFTLPANPTTTTAAVAGSQFNFGGGDTKTQAKPAALFSTSAQSPAFGSTPKPVATTPSSAPSFGFGSTQPTATSNIGFGIPGSVVSSATTTTPQFGLPTSKPGTTTLSSLLGSAPAAVAATTVSTGLGFGSAIGATAATLAPTTVSTGLGFGSAIGATAATLAPTTVSTGLGFGSTIGATTTTATPATGASLFGSTSTSVATIAPGLGLSTAAPTAFSTAASTALSTTTVAPTYSTTALPSTGSLTFGQLEDSINKWTIDLEEQGKFFINQAKQLNAWDSLLITNGEKILNLNGSIERVKQQQQQLDQELDFVLAQQKELEELITPLEKELLEIPVTDIDRNQMYQFSEIIDSQLKQMSDDLKEIIENINESNKNEEISNPITQISRILNAHMNSLQWLDRNTSQISSHLEQISKIQDTNRRNFTQNHSFNNNSFNM